MGDIIFEKERRKEWMNRNRQEYYEMIPASNSRRPRLPHTARKRMLSTTALICCGE